MKNKTTVLAAGTFDILHLGHLHYLAHAKSLGDELVVIVARDSIAAKLGKKPIHNENERLEIIRSLRLVDKAVLGNEKDMLAPIRKIKPDIIFLGYDQKIPAGLEKYCKERKIKIIHDTCSRNPRKYKTTKIKEKIAGTSRSEQLFRLSKINVKYCPWCSEKTPEEYVKELVSEVEEVQEAIAKKDYENLREELGDVIWDALVLAHICEKKGLFNGEDVISKIIEKIERRKPWLIQGKKVSKDEAARIWNAVKKMEKMIKN